MRAGLVCTLVLFAGCGEDGREVTVDLLIAPSDCKDKALPLSESDLPDGAVRLTVSKSAGANGEEELVCNALAERRPGTSGGLSFAVPIGAGERLDLSVEIFDWKDPPRLLAQGQVLGANSRARAEPMQIFLARRSQGPEPRASCTGGAMTQGRAFHSATLLPNGEVLILGGVTIGESGQLAFAEVVEVYDPRSGRFREVGRLSSGRAFHSTSLVAAGSWEGPFDLVLVGGLAARAGSKEPALAEGGTGDPLRLLPGPGAERASGLRVRYYPWVDELALFPDPPQVEGRIFHAAALLADRRAVLVGGASELAAGKLTAVRNFEIISGTASHRGPFELQRSRVGAMVAPLSTEKLLLFGGNLESTGEESGKETVELLSLEPEKERATQASLSSVAAPALAFGTLTPAGRAGQDPHLLLAGGFAIKAGRAVDVHPEKTLYRISEGEPGKISVSAVPESEAWTPVAFGASARVEPQGEVILSGGCPAACGGLKLCGSAELFRYHAGRLKLEAKLVSPRMGHAMLILPGKIALLCGGLAEQAGRLATLSSAELYPLSDGGHASDPWAREPARLKSDRTCEEP